MHSVLTPVQMARADQAAIAAGTPTEVLMERAGRAVAWSARRLLSGTYGRRVVVVCGKGNNGGDGIVAARALDRWGVRVAVFNLADLTKDPADSSNSVRYMRELERADLVIDAMYGIGFRGVLTGEAAWVAQSFNESGLPVVAVDIPSGVDGLTGEVRGAAVRATTTVCFAALKPGLVLEPGASHAGVVEVIDIGIEVPGHYGGAADGGIAEGSEAPLVVAGREDIAAWFVPRDPDTHKWAVGGVFVVAGSEGMTGAAMLVSRGALRAGAGIVVCGLPGDAAAERASGTEVITRALASTPSGALDEPAAKEVFADLDRFRALVVGPGLGADERAFKAVRALIAGAPVPVVVDADGLNALAGHLDILRDRSMSTILTPHAGEYERLAGAPVGADRVAAARDLAKRTGAVVLLKGSRTVVADSDGRTAINVTGGPRLATAGTGDVLAGVVGALVAQGFPVWEAAVAGAWVHGRAAAGLGAGLVAGDLTDALPTVLAESRA